uniref:Putative secreted protein n=1 Tax=Anopheles marajoara TaxID=58244 RepID=A0A2M4C0M2_9DIPT
MVPFRVVLLLISVFTIAHGFWTSCEPHGGIFRNVQWQLSKAAREYGTRYSDEYDSAASSLQRLLDAARTKITDSGNAWRELDQYVKKKQQHYGYYPAQQQVPIETVLEELLISLQTAGQNNAEAKAALDQYNTLVQEVASLQANFYKVGNQTALLESDKLQLNHTISLLEQKNRELTAKLESKKGNLSP